MQTPVTGQQGHQPDTHDQPHDHQHSHDHDDLEYGDIHEHSAGLVEYIRLALLAAVIIASLTGWWKGVISRDWLAFAATLIGGFPIFAELVEGYTVGSGRRAIEKLINALPRTVTVRRDGVEREVDANEIKSGETIIIRPGERIPADGVVSKGHSFVDQASITGEPMAVEKFEASKVFAGTINNDGVLEVRAERIGRDTTFGKIIEIVEQAEKSKAPVQRIADKLAAGLVYFALGAAVLTFIVTR